MKPKIYKAILVLVAVVALTGASFIEKSLALDREALGLTRYTELKGAPPLLTLTTVALGGFRGLISNVLWMRASDLQEEDKYFEMVQLADWITKLEPTFTQVWIYQSWNMAYNISVKFKDFDDRWRWVKAGIELLRDEGLKYNPHDILMHRELSWYFQHKVGQNMDDAQGYYKQMWANEMASVFKTDAPNWDELINPQTPDAKKRSELLRDKYKMDPVLMKEIDAKYGPLEWRLPEAHAIYWAVQGMNDAKMTQRRYDTNELITLRRSIYQSMLLSFQRGRLVANKAMKQFEFGPNLAIIPNVNASYEREMADDPKNRDHIETAQRNFLRDAVFFLYTYNRQADAMKWYKYLSQHYPNKPLLDGLPDSLPGTLSLDDYAIGAINTELKDAGRDRTEAVLEGLEGSAYESLAEDDDERYLGLDRLAGKIWEHYYNKVNKGQGSLERVGLPELPEIKRVVLKRLLNGELPPPMADQLRTKLGITKEAFSEPTKNLDPHNTTNGVSAPVTHTNDPTEGAHAIKSDN